MRLRYYLTAAALAGLSSVAAAQTGSSGTFTIHNDTESNIVSGFYTNDGSGWSANWLSEQIRPGDTAEASFTDQTGPCEQTFQVGWAGQDGKEILDDPVDINICDASNVYLGDNEITYD